MKRILFFAVLMASGSIQFSGCGDDDSSTDTDADTDTDTDTDTDSDTDTDTDTDTDSLEGVYISQEILENDAPVTLVDDTVLRLEFGPYDDYYQSPTFSAYAGCNTMSGAYEIDGGEVVVSNWGTTEIACETELHEQDEWYFGFLSSSPAIAASGDELELDNGVIWVRFLDEEVANPDLDLVGTEWIVDTVIDEFTAMEASVDPPAKLTFGSDGALVFYTACNDGNASYSVNGANITLGDVVSTDMACPDQMTQDIEDIVLSVLEPDIPISWEIDVDRLNLTNGDFGLGALGSN